MCDGEVFTQTDGVKIWGVKTTSMTVKEKKQVIFFIFSMFNEEESVSGPEVLPLLLCWFICLSSPW